MVAKIANIYIDKTRPLHIQCDIQTEMSVLLIEARHPVWQVFGTAGIIVSLGLAQIDASARKNRHDFHIWIFKPHMEAINVVALHRSPGATGDRNTKVGIDRRPGRKCKSFLIQIQGMNLRNTRAVQLVHFRRIV